MTRERKSGLVRIALPVAIVVVAGMMALRCGGRHRADSTEVRRGTVVGNVEAATSWWSLPVQSTEPIHYKPLAVSLAASRGTELFELLLDPDGSDIGVRGTSSNIEFRPLAASFVQSGNVDNISLAAASADGGATIDVFWRNADQTIGTRQWNGTSFVTPVNVPQYGLVLSGVGIASMTNRVDIFGIGLDHNVYQNWRGTGAWVQWSNLGSPTGLAASLQPAAVYLPGQLLYIFAVASDGTVWTRNNPYSPTWSPWTSGGGNVASGLAVTFSGTSRIDIFAVDGTGTVQRQTLDTSTRTDTSPGTWGTWTAIAPPLATIMTTTIDGATRYIAPTAVARAEGAIDLFVRDAGGGVELMTIRPEAIKSGGSERAMGIGQPACPYVIPQENTAAATDCNGAGAYDFLLSGAYTILRVPESCFFDAGPPSSVCNVPSGGSGSITNCAPYEIRLPGNNRQGTVDGGLDVTNIGVTGPMNGNDNQIARLNDGSVIALLHHGICSQAPCLPADAPWCNYPGCNSAGTSGDIILRTTPADCGTNWTYQGVVDVCQKIDPDGSHGCYYWADSSSPTGYWTAGGDRPEMAVRRTQTGTELYVTESFSANGATWVGPANHLLVKSIDQGVTWTNWFYNTKTALLADSPVEITTVGDNVVLYGRPAGQKQVELWDMSALAPENPVRQYLDVPDFDYLLTNDGPNSDQSILSIAQAGSSQDGDYVRIVYPTLMGSGAQAVYTALVKMDVQRHASSIVPGSLTRITADQAPVTGSILYPTLIEADRMAGPGDERPPVVLFWVETTNTPSNLSGCFHANYCNWGPVSIKAKVFRGASQSPTYVIDTAHAQWWKGNGDYVHGGARYAGGSTAIDRFFLHWYNDNNNGARLPMARQLDVVR